jgi:hypothetical protein
LVFLALLVVLLPTAPATADHRLGAWHSEQDMLVEARQDGYRETLILDPGPNNYVTRENLLALAGRYAPHGYSRQFLWYAPESRQVIDGSAPWAGCGVNVGRDADGFCSNVNTDPTKTIHHTFGGPTELRVLDWQGAIIALVCGNWGTGITGKDPVPTISGTKFLDVDRDGLRGTGERGLNGWTFQLFREQSFVGQGTGLVTTAVSDADGGYRFDLRGQGPGRYYVEEAPRDGWHRTTAERQYVTVDKGIGDRNLTVGDFGNVETSADAVKADFRLLDAPSRFEADEPTTFTARAVLENRGPADLIEVDDGISVTVPPDCTATADRPLRRLVLHEGAPVTVDFLVTVLCTDPSNHPLTVVDDLRVMTPGATDPDASSNLWEIRIVPEVFDRTDIAVTTAEVACPAAIDVRVGLACTVSGTVTSGGDYITTTVSTLTALDGPDDCTWTARAPELSGKIGVAPGAPVAVSTVYDVECAQRSFHPFTGMVTARVDQEHLEEIAPGDESRVSSNDVVEIFEEVDLSAGPLNLGCTEREISRTASACTATMTVSNVSDANSVDTVARLTPLVAPGCTSEPANPVEHLLDLDAHTSARVVQTWQLACPGSVERHAFEVGADVRNADSDPHADDRTAANDAVALRWQPTDTKPRSLPSAVNIGMKGMVPFAVLSTATLDAVAEVDLTSLRFGATGNEDSVRSCAQQGEHVDDDGRLDLICHADTQATGIACATTVTIVTGRLRDGSAFQSQDDVLVTPCKKK